MASNIRLERICQYCGRQFTAKTTVTQYCGETCSKRGYKQKKRNERIQVSNQEVAKIKSKPIDDIKAKEFLTVRDVAKLLNSSRQAVYDMIEKGTLKAVNLSERKTLIKRSEIDKIFN